MKLVSLLFLLSLAIPHSEAQTRFISTYSASVTSSSTTTLTIQQPATGSKILQLESATLQCPGKSFSVDQSQNGTAATSTSGTAVQIGHPGAAISAVANIFTASNVGSGTAIGSTLTYAAGNIAQISLIGVNFSIGGTATNYSLKLTNTDTTTCTATLQIIWSER